MSMNKEFFCKSYSETSVSKSSLDSQSADGDFYGPTLPPHLIEINHPEGKKKQTVYGPVLPVQFKEKEKDKLNEVSFPILEEKNTNLIGPEIPEYLKPVFESETEETVSRAPCEEDDNFGPSTTLMASGNVIGYHKLLLPQNLHKNTNSVSESNIKRESWMTQLPEKKRSNFGLLPRHFSSKIHTNKETDDSVWTDTPADIEKKKIHGKNKDYKEIARLKRLQERDQEMEKLVKKATKKLRKKESLLEMHRKNMKKKKKIEIKMRKKEGKVLPERRPFDRNVDLQFRKVDEVQKRATLNKSQFLNDRFAPGQSKFL